MTTSRSGDLFAYTLRLGDDALVAAQRLVQWCTFAPLIEEDVALANIALDLLGQARALLGYAGEVEGLGRDEDALAYLRDEAEFGNAALVELPNGNFAFTMTKLFLFGAYQVCLFERLRTSADLRLAAIAVKALKEVRYHVEHAATWLIRLGDGTELSGQRAASALAEIWPWTHELFERDALTDRVAASGHGVDPATLRTDWLALVDPVLASATLERPADGWAPTGARSGRHTEHFGYLISELQSLHRAHAGASW